MKKVITYGTYDLLHYGHIRLLERAKNLGDYLIVGITADDFDKARGKINVQQSLAERIEAVRRTGIVDEIIIEEYEGQKIDDIRKYNVDIFTVGSDWVGKFDYLNEFCQVVYLDRTQGVSSTELRSENQKLRLGIFGNPVKSIEKFLDECKFVNGIEIVGICCDNPKELSENYRKLSIITTKESELLEAVDAIYINTHPQKHIEIIENALYANKHVLCETPMVVGKENAFKLFELAEQKECILTEGIKTAYGLAFERLCLLLITGIIGKVVSVDVTCTSLSVAQEEYNKELGSMYLWGPYCMLAIFSILGTHYKEKRIYTKRTHKNYDAFSKVDFVYDSAVATMKVGNYMKSEGNLIISGTKGYIYVPAPWWKMDYFEVRYENMMENKRYFYQLEGEGIRYMISNFVKAIRMGRKQSNVSEELTEAISDLLRDYEKNIDVINIV